MLRAQVRLRRRLTGEQRTDEYAVTLAGEVLCQPDDAEGVIEKISELFHLADEALCLEIDRDRRGLAIGHQDEEPRDSSSLGSKDGQPRTSGRSTPLPINRPHRRNREPLPEDRSVIPDKATLKQQQYVQNLVKRKGLSQEDLDAVLIRVSGSAKRLADLTKREAGSVIDHLTNLEPEAAR